MRRSELEQKVTDVLVEHLGVTPEQVRQDVLLVPDHDQRGVVRDADKPSLGCDSLDVVEVTMALEEAFGITISDAKVEQLQSGTVGQLFDMVATLEIMS